MAKRVENSFTPQERKDLKRKHFHERVCIAALAAEYDTGESVICRILGVPQ